MNLFRSEAHIEQWLSGRTPGTTIAVTKLAELAHHWWGDRLADDWRPHTRDHNQAILDRLELTTPFWQLA